MTAPTSAGGDAVVGAGGEVDAVSLGCAADAAAALGGERIPHDLVARIVGLASSGRANPQQLRKAVAQLLEEGARVSAADAANRLERLLAARAPLPAGRDLDAASGLLRRHGATLLVAGAAGYPAQLADAWPELGAPLWLFCRAPGGRLPSGPAAAIVGSRHATLDGLRTARNLGAMLARCGVTVVSGMARGIDQAAHQGALDADGATVAVLGTGFGVDYPAKDGRVREAVAASGGLVTEHVPGVGAKPIHFLWRNRIISGLADVTVVVEGRARSGALQTARMAAAQGREVFAVPGSINLPTSQAPLALIRDGAQPLTRLEDVLDALPAIGPTRLADPAGGIRAPLPPRLDPAASAVLDLLSATPSSPGRLAAAAGLPISQIMAAISELTRMGVAAATARGVVAAAGMQSGPSGPAPR